MNEKSFVNTNEFVNNNKDEVLEKITISSDFLGKKQGITRGRFTDDALEISLEIKNEFVEGQPTDSKVTTTEIMNELLVEKSINSHIRSEWDKTEYKALFSNKNALGSFLEDMKNVGSLFATAPFIDKVASHVKDLPTEQSREQNIR